MNKEVSFSNFVERFPEIDLPITLSEEMHMTFSSENPPLQSEMIAQHIMRAEEKEADEFTEFIPCFRLKDTHEFVALVYWRADLMNYQYIMATYDSKGKVLDRQVLGGTHADGNAITQSVATIDADWSIHIVTGQSKTRDKVYEAESSRAFELELLSEGQIVNVV